MWSRSARVPQHPRALLDQAVEESRKALARARVVIAVEEPDEPAWFDPHLLSRVLRHLLENAARFTPPGGRILLGSRRVGDRLEFRVEDDGPGIDAGRSAFHLRQVLSRQKRRQRAREPGWDWPSAAPFWPRMADGSRPRARRARAPASASGCRLL